MMLDKLAYTFSLVAALGFGAACGGGGGSGIPEAHREDEFIATICDALVKCNAYPDVATCESTTSSNIEGLLLGVEAGRVEYDGNSAEDCLSFFSNALASCEAFGFGEEDESCDDTFVGLVEVGGTCWYGEECAGDAYCEQDCGDAECCTGVCTAEPALAQMGEDCSNKDCVSGSYCGQEPEAETPTCLAPAALGQPCYGFGPDACQGDAVCDSFGQPGTCFMPGPEEGACGDTPILQIACMRTDNYCDPADSVCKPLIAVGSGCNLELDNCVDYAYCAENSMCMASPGVGEDCVVDGQPSCLGGLECVSGKCTLPEECLPTS
jgi:hypothetical protein